MQKKRKFLLMSVVEEEVAVVAGAVVSLLMSVYITINYIYRKHNSIFLRI